MLLALLHRAEFLARRGSPARPPRVRFNQALMARALPATALHGRAVLRRPAARQGRRSSIGALLLLTRRVKSARVYAEIDWSLLLMFVGLFIIVAGRERALLTPDVVARGRPAAPRSGSGAERRDRGALEPGQQRARGAGAEAVRRRTAGSRPAWLVVAMASTLAGNFTVLGSIANLIVVEKAARRGVAIGFWDYFRVGAPLTVLTILIGTLWLGRG